MKKSDAIKHFGGIVQLAEVLGIRPQAISQWSENIPLGRAYQLQILTKGKLKVSDCDKPTHEGQPT